MIVLVSQYLLKLIAELLYTTSKMILIFCGPRKYLLDNASKCSVADSSALFRPKTYQNEHLSDYCRFVDKQPIFHSFYRTVWVRLDFHSKCNSANLGHDLLSPPQSRRTRRYHAGTPPRSQHTTHC
jgi:hypothetical protein